MCREVIVIGWGDIRAHFALDIPLSELEWFGKGLLWTYIDVVVLLLKIIVFPVSCELCGNPVYGKPTLLARRVLFGYPVYGKRI